MTVDILAVVLFRWVVRGDALVAEVARLLRFVRREVAMVGCALLVVVAPMTVVIGIYAHELDPDLPSPEVGRPISSVEAKCVWIITAPGRQVMPILRSLALTKGSV